MSARPIENPPLTSVPFSLWATVDRTFKYRDLTWRELFALVTDRYGENSFTLREVRSLIIREGRRSFPVAARCSDRWIRSGLLRPLDKGKYVITPRAPKDLLETVRSVQDRKFTPSEVAAFFFVLDGATTQYSDIAKRTKWGRGSLQAMADFLVERGAMRRELVYRKRSSGSREIPVPVGTRFQMRQSALAWINRWDIDPALGRELGFDQRPYEAIDMFDDLEARHAEGEQFSIADLCRAWVEIPKSKGAAGGRDKNARTRPRSRASAREWLFGARGAGGKRIERFNAAVPDSGAAGASPRGFWLTLERPQSRKGCYAVTAIHRPAPIRSDPQPSSPVSLRFALQFVAAVSKDFTREALERQREWSIREYIIVLMYRGLDGRSFTATGEEASLKRLRGDTPKQLRDNGLLKAAKAVDRREPQPYLLNVDLAKINPEWLLASHWLNRKIRAKRASQWPRRHRKDPIGLAVELLRRGAAGQFRFRSKDSIARECGYGPTETNRVLSGLVKAGRLTLVKKGTARTPAAFSINYEMIDARGEPSIAEVIAELRSLRRSVGEIKQSRTSRSASLKKAGKPSEWTDSQWILIRKAAADDTRQFHNALDFLNIPVSRALKAKGLQTWSDTHRRGGRSAQSTIRHLKSRALKAVKTGA